MKLMKLSELRAHIDQIIEEDGDIPVALVRAFDGDRGIDLAKFSGSVLDIRGHVEGEPYEGPVMVFHLKDQPIVTPREDTARHGEDELTQEETCH